jgi:hypothetical protein
LDGHHHELSPITVADVDSAEKISGPDLGTTKGKSTRHAPELVMEHLIEVPTEFKAQLKECHDKPSPVVMCTETKECAETKECPGKLKECSDVPIPGPVANGSLHNEYESTTKRWGDYTSKPLQGMLFRIQEVQSHDHGTWRLTLFSLNFYII